MPSVTPRIFAAEGVGFRVAHAAGLGIIGVIGVWATSTDGRTVRVYDGPGDLVTPSGSGHANGVDVTISSDSDVFSLMGSGGEVSAVVCGTNGNVTAVPSVTPRIIT